jgi:hypothetical protein
MTLERQAEEIAKLALEAPRRIVDEPEPVTVCSELLRGMLLTSEDLAALPPPEPLIEGYLVRDSLAVLYGRPGTAKSFIAISMALAVVTGSPWFGHDVRRGPALYVAGEGTSGLAQRQRAWQEACGVDNLEGMYWLPSAVNLLQPDWSRGLAELAADLGVVLVIIDTLARSMAGGDENRSGDMAQAIEAADVIRRRSGATVGLVHHTPKEGETPRGHSALEGAVDTAILLKRSGSIFTLTTEKQKDIPQVEPLVFGLEARFGSCLPTQIAANSVAANAFGLVGLELTLRDVIGSNAGSDGLPATRLQSLSGIPERSFYRALKALDKRGVIRNVSTSHRPRWALAHEEPHESLPLLPHAAMTAAKSLLPAGGSLDPRQRGSDGDGTNEELNHTSRFKGRSVHFSSRSPHWVTPPELYAELDREFGFDFDPCPLGGGDFDGLEVEWGSVNFVNPPYGREIGRWIAKAVAEWGKGKTVVLLIPARTDTTWWHNYITRASQVRFLKGRLHFSGSTSGAPFPSAIAIFRRETEDES